MIYGIYSVKDALIGFNAPTIMVNEEVAKRNFQSMVKKSDIGNDLSLWDLGTFDEDTGTIIPKMPTMVTFGKE